MRSLVRILLPCLAAALAAGRSEAASGPWFETPESKVRLISRFAAAPAGGDAGLAVEFRLAPGWHVYWKNAGDAGFPPKLEIEGSLLDSATLRFPAPTRFELPGGLVALGYEGQAIYPVDARLDVAAKESRSLTGKLDYLICAESCIPYLANLELTLPVDARPLDDKSADPSLDSDTAPLVAAARARLPSPAPPGVGGELVAAGENAWALALTFAVPGVLAAAPDLFFDPHPLLSIGRPERFASSAGPGFRVPVKAIDPTRPLPNRLRFAWTATGFERAGTALAWEGELDLPRPRHRGRLSFFLPFIVAFSVFPVLWLILRRARRARVRAASKN